MSASSNNIRTHCVLRTYYLGKSGIFYVHITVEFVSIYDTSRYLASLMKTTNVWMNEEVQTRMGRVLLGGHNHGAFYFREFCREMNEDPTRFVEDNTDKHVRYVYPTLRYMTYKYVYNH
jgi:hypothetical protein